MDTQLSYVDPEKLQMRQEVRTTVQPSNVDERNPLTKSEPEVTTQRSDIKQEIFPKRSSDIQPSVHEKQPRKTNEIPDDVSPSVLTQDTEKQPRKMNEVPNDVSPPALTQDTEKQPRKMNEILGDVSASVLTHDTEKQPRKMNEVPDDVSPPVLTQDTEKQPRRKDSVQPLDVDQQRPPPMEAQDGVQLPEVIDHEGPEATIQSPDDKRETSEMEVKTPEAGVDVQLSNIVAENPRGVMPEQQPRKIAKPVDDDQEELESAVLSQDDTLSNNEAANSATILHVGQETLGKENGVAEGDTHRSYVDQEKLQIREELQKDVQSSNVDDELSPENSYDIQPSDGDREGLLIKEQYSTSERQPRKINEVPDDVSPPVLTQDTEKQPRRKDNVQPLDANQQRPPTMEAQDGVQLLEVIHHEEPEATLQSPGGKRGISEMEGKTPEVGVDVQLSSIVPENPPGVMPEQQPRKKPLDDVQPADPVENRLPRKRNSKDLNEAHSPDVILE